MGSELRMDGVDLENRLIPAPMAGMLRLSLRMACRRPGCAMTCVKFFRCYWQTSRRIDSPDSLTFYRRRVGRF
ncbi:MAG: hypothetical protein IH624_18335 [Phycisphaerae bacterium]|nr:hypothetical protein [Phycisphaerae bacterium]